MSLARLCHKSIFSFFYSIALILLPLPEVLNNPTPLPLSKSIYRLLPLRAQVALDGLSPNRSSGENRSSQTSLDRQSKGLDSRLEERHFRKQPLDGCSQAFA